MLRRLKKFATVVGYAKAPKTTYVLKHPVKGTRALLAARGARSLVTTRAGAVITTAVAAVPVTFFAVKALGRWRS